MEFLPLENLDLEDVQGVQDWHERFSQLCIINPKVTDDNKTSYYITMLGKTAYRRLKDLAYPQKVASMEVDDLQKLLQNHIQPINFELSERERFHNLNQRPDETLRSFILRVQQQAAKCNFGAILEDQMRDRLVAGVKDCEIKRKLLKDTKLTFNSAKSLLEEMNDVNTALQRDRQPLTSEVFSSQVTSVRGGRKPSHTASGRRQSSNTRRGEERSFHPNAKRSSYSNSSTTKGRFYQPSSCDSCGGIHQRHTCKFRQVECHTCHKRGHIAKVCRSKAKVGLVNTDSDQDVTVLTLEKGQHLYHNIVFCNGKNKDFIMDTGSPITFLPIQDFKAMGFDQSEIRNSKTTIRGVSGDSLAVLGEFFPMVKTAQGDIPLKVVITVDGPSVLGLDGLRALQVQLVFEASSTSTVTPTSVSNGLSSEIKDLIVRCGNNQGGMQIPPVHLEVTGQPIFMGNRSIPFGLRSAVKDNLDEMVKKGILQPVQSSPWATPIVTVLKPNGQPRICGDYRITVNPLLHQTATTTLDVESMFAGLHGCKFFSKIDLSNAFLQIPLDDSSSQLTTINTMWGLYRYKYLPFGLNVSPGIFQRVIDSIIARVTGTRAYQDDIIVSGATQAEHDANLFQLLQTLQEHNVQINTKKSVFKVNQLKYLGYILTGEGISPDLDRIQALRKAPKPSKVEELRSFLGFAQYYAKFTPNFSNQAKPLYDLLTNDFNWTVEHDQVYDQLLQSLLDGKVLKSFRVGIPSELIVDASEHSIGAVLEQENHPIVCISRKLSASEKNYSQTQKEALAIHWAVLRLHKYLYGNKFVIVTDHKALQYLLHPSSSLGKATSAMVQRWALHLSAYNYVIVHRPGKDIAHADYMSRHAFKEDAMEPGDNTILLTNPLPVTRNELLEETHLAYGQVVAGLRNGWSLTARKRFPELYARRADLRLQADGAILFQNRNLIPPTCRLAVLKHLHMGHFGRDKMVSLSRLLCWWPTINADIVSFIKDCEKCKQKPRSHANWSPWPVTYQPMQRLHADYCGPFLGRYWALVIEDAFSKFAEVFLTTNASAAFTKRALQNLFAREGIAQVLVTDNGTHFTQRELQEWLHSIGCNTVYTAPRHPQSNGQAENFVRTLKTAIRAGSPTNLEQLQTCVDNFLLQYRNAVHASTKKSPAMLFKGRNLRSSMVFDTTDVTFFRGNDARPCDGLIIGHLGNRMFKVMDRDDGSVHRRHKDQVTFSVHRPCEHSYSRPTTTETIPQPVSREPSQSQTDVPPSTSQQSQQPTSPQPIPSPSLLPGSVTPRPQPLRRSQRDKRIPRGLEDFNLTGRNCDRKH